MVRCVGFSGDRWLPTARVAARCLRELLRPQRIGDLVALGGGIAVAVLATSAEPLLGFLPGSVGMTTPLGGEDAQD